MNQPIKTFQEAPSIGTSQAGKPRSRRRLVLISIVALLVVAGIVWKTRQESAGGGMAIEST